MVWEWVHSIQKYFPPGVTENFPMLAHLPAKSSQASFPLRKPRSDEDEFGETDGILFMRDPADAW